MKDTEFHTDYKNIDRLRQNIFKFTLKALYGASFKKWYESGCWNNRYIPFSLLKGKEMVANLSISEMKILIEGQHLTIKQPENSNECIGMKGRCTNQIQ